MALPYGEALHAAAYATVLQGLLRESSNAQAVAFALGVDVAEVEVGKPGLYDPDAQVFVAHYEYASIRSLTARGSVAVRLAVEDGIRRGLNERALIPVLRESLTRTRAEARTIARTEMNRAANWGRFSAWKRSRSVRFKQAIATLDSRVRPDHLVVHGETVPLDEPFTRGAAAGRLMPPWGPNCRCTAAPTTALSYDFGEAEARALRRRVDEQARRDFEARRATGLTAFCPVHEATAPRLGLAPAAVRREIPGLLAAELAHEMRVDRILAAWPRLALQGLGPKPALSAPSLQRVAAW